MAVLHKQSAIPNQIPARYLKHDSQPKVPVTWFYVISEWT